MPIERLVILGSTVTALAVVRDAHAHGVEPVVVDSADGIAFRSRYAVRAALDSGASDEAAVDRVLALGSEGTALVATGDPWVRFIVRHRARLEAAFARVLHPSNEALDICLDKQKFAAWCLDHGFDAPRSWWPGAGPRPAELQYPVLVRPAQTLHGRAHVGLPKAIEVRSENELAALLARFAAAKCAAVVSESLLSPGVTQYSVPFAREGAALLSFVARKLRPAADRCSVGTFVELAPHSGVETLARRAVEQLDYYGIGEAEILHVAATGRAYLIEINARPWLQYALAPASGHDFLGLLLRRQASGLRPRTTRLRWIDLHSDLFGALSSSEGAVRRGELGLGTYLSSLLRANVFARFDWKDPQPAFVREAPARAAAEGNAVASARNESAGPR